MLFDELQPLLKGLSYLNVIFINFDVIPSFTSPVETSSPLSPYYNGFHSEVNTSDWFNSEGFSPHYSMYFCSCCLFAINI